MKPKVLYVDDEPINLQLFQLNFSKAFDINVADSGMTALELLKGNNGFHAIISDMKMPRMSGIEFIRAAKNLYPHLKFFILSGYDISSEVQESIKNGLIVRYFRKPFNKSEIEECIHSISF